MTRSVIQAVVSDPTISVAGILAKVCGPSIAAKVKRENDADTAAAPRANRKRKNYETEELLEVTEGIKGFWGVFFLGVSRNRTSTLRMCPFSHIFLSFLVLSFLLSFVWNMHWGFLFPHSSLFYPKITLSFSVIHFPFFSWAEHHNPWKFPQIIHFHLSQNAEYIGAQLTAYSPRDPVYIRLGFALQSKSKDFITKIA